MRLDSLLERNRGVVLSFATAIIVGFAAVELRARWLLHQGTAADSVKSLQSLQVVSDVAALIGCAVACAMLGRVAWRLRRQVSFGATGYILVLIPITVGLKRLLDVHAVGHAMDRGNPHFAVMTAAVSVLIACGVASLIPFFQKMIDFGMTAEDERDKFMALAEHTQESLCLLESSYNPLRRIVDFKVTFINAKAEKLLGRQSADVVGHKISEVLPQINSNGVLELLRQVPTTGVPYMGEIKSTDEDGSRLWCTLRAIKIHGGLAVMFDDLSAQKERQSRIDELHKFSQSLIEDAPFSIIAIDANGIITAVNSAAEQLTKYRRHELTGKHSIVVLHDTAELSARSMALSEETGTPVQAGFQTLSATLRQRRSNESEWTYVCKDGSRISVHLALTVLHGSDGEVAGYLAVAFDITERKKLSDSVSFLAHHDAMTQLPNRILLTQRMGEAVERAKVLDQQISVVMVDLDHFKRINDSLGHHAGDEVLKAVAERLQSAVRKTDTVSRVGGDEFVVLMPNSGGKATTLRCVQRMLEKIQAPMPVAGRELNITASVGVCVYPDWGADPVSLLRNADAAMYAAKESGRNSYQVFSDTMVKADADRLEMEMELRHALDKNQMFVVYQPQVNCKSGEVVGIEALIRWNHPVRGLISPAEFIPAAEDCGLILPIGQWVLRRACKEAKAMQNKLGRRFTIAINLSPRQFLQDNLADLVEAALEESGLAATDLELEITEYTLMISSTETSHALGRLREIGVRIAIDDFGTGFSSFKYILEYEVDRLKIDRSFIAKCPQDTNAASIVRTVIAMAHGLHLKVVAEGVETEEQAAFLVRRHCDEAQGYLFGRPMPMNDVMDLMQATPKKLTASATNRPKLQIPATAGA